MSAAAEPWQDQALCAEVDHDLFFPNRGDNVRPAQQICVTCPVRIECLQFALRHQIDHGVWGGTTPDMRHRMRGTAA